MIYRVYIRGIYKGKENGNYYVSIGDYYYQEECLGLPRLSVGMFICATINISCIEGPFTVDIGVPLVVWYSP